MAEKSHDIKVTSEEKDNPDYNVFRDSPLRYMGYANELGESFRYQFPKLVRPSYVLAFGYCGMDALSAGYRAWKQPAPPPRNIIQSNGNKNDDHQKLENQKKAQVAISTMDTLLWQCLASVMIPGITINVIVRHSRKFISRISTNQQLPKMASKWFPTAMGIISIPIIIHPIDNFVDFCLDNTTRKWIKTQQQLSQ